MRVNKRNRSVQGTWVFALLPRTSREKTVKEVFDPKFTLNGIDGVKNAISKLPQKTTIYVVARLPSGMKPKAKGSEDLRLPPAQIIEAIKEHAEKGNIIVEIPRASRP